jgi:hypothetical protein
MTPFTSVAVAQLIDNMVEFWFFIADSGQNELRLRLDKPHGWPVDSKRRKLHGHSRYLR